MRIYINIENRNEQPHVYGCWITTAEAEKAATKKVEWEHGAYTPDHFAIAVPVDFCITDHGAEHHFGASVLKPLPPPGAEEFEGV